MALALTVSVPVEIEENWLYHPDNDPEQGPRFTNKYVAKLNCGCGYIGERVYGYGQTPEQAYADLKEQYDTGNFRNRQAC